ncbi:MAG: hypothetical protein PHC88_16900, partial [Terrimicrobiaceae bacterium]|nr:hypothetical protein [Terrimicrobiaceae bacterium]
EVLDVQARVAAALKAANRAARTADELAAATGADAETIFHCAHQLAANHSGFHATPGATPAADTFSFAA